MTLPLNESQIRFVRPFEPSGPSTHWACTHCGSWHSSETSWMAHLENEGLEWDAVVCDECARALDPTVE